MQLLLVTGPGGAGTTSLACAVAVQARRRDRPVGLLTWDDDPLPVEVLDGADRLALDRLAVDRAKELTERGDAVLGQLGLDPVPGPLRAGLPTAEPARFWPLDTLLHEDQDPDRLVVLDLGPLAQAARLLTAPAAWIAASGHLLSVTRRVERAMTIPADPLAELSDDFVAMLGRVAAALTGPRTSLAVIRTPGRERDVAHWLPRITATGVSVAALIGNRDHDAEPVSSRASASASASASAEHFSVPELPGDPAAVVQALADELDRRYPDGFPNGPSGAAPSDASFEASSDGQVRAVTREGELFRMRIPVALARPGALTLTRVDDDLVLDGPAPSAAAAVVRLPSVLRRCEVIAAELERPGRLDAALRLDFRPDPDLWPRS